MDSAYDDVHALSGTIEGFFYCEDWQQISHIFQRMAQDCLGFRWSGGQYSHQTPRVALKNRRAGKWLSRAIPDMSHKTTFYDSETVREREYVTYAVGLRVVRSTSAIWSLLGEA